MSGEGRELGYSRLQEEQAKVKLHFIRTLQLFLCMSIAVPRIGQRKDREMVRGPLSKPSHIFAPSHPLMVKGQYQSYGSKRYIHENHASGVGNLIVPIAGRGVEVGHR